jgi:50S ribosomal protein L16 3-hydroxylase
MIDITKPLQLLGGLSATNFMREYWQKKPLLIKSCINCYKPIISKNQLFELAKKHEVKARLIQQSIKTKKWSIKHSPILSLPKTSNPWTLLVSNMNEYNDEIYKFMQMFSFIPYARLDDVMISYANDGASVGAHFDSYDVFLFQGMGKRKWQISSQKDLSLVEDAPIKILKEFFPQQEWILEEGDMLYLPPQYAHFGVAIGECMTYSVGFRAPVLKELVFEYFMDMVGLLEDYDIPQTLYTDAKQKAITCAGEIPSKMSEFLQHTLDNLQMPSASHLLGMYLTRTNSEILPMENPLEFEEFLTYEKIYLHKASKAQYDSEYFYINGEKSACEILEVKYLQALADNKEMELNTIKFIKNLIHEVYDWYQMGWVTL